ncbi:TPA: tyrosine-type recombinase/integrase [Salmonella enterica subsp. enterica serovar Bredeney]|nr:tyrosine-type recombinase/integrase [Salmonella enterica subsp. enterica serovar Bredeney]HCB5296376.1 tyrosine-type recombinase/integrase [Salmonella enterica subsp. enterica serovar Bredeney]
MSDEQYAAIYDEATPALRVAMEVSYLCAVRQGDVLEMVWGDVMDAGLFIEQNKTGKKQIKEWSPRLRNALEMARRELNSNNASGVVIPGPSGGRMNKKTFNNWWNDAKQQASLKLGRPIPGTFHDIKAKAISDYEGSSRDKQLFSGHKTENQVNTYDRKVKVTPTLNAPQIIMKK